MSKHLLAAILLSVALSAQAQSGYSFKKEHTEMGAKAEQPANDDKLPDDVGGLLTKEQLEAAKAIAVDAAERGKEIAKDTLGLEKIIKGNSDHALTFDKSIYDDAKDLQVRADKMRDSSMIAERDKLLAFLGVEPAKRKALYYFVSFSMPLDVLRSYALEAMWSGGILVFRGIPKGMTMKQFLVENIYSLVYGKGTASVVILDPKLFDLFEVSVVPTIVWSDDAVPSCDGSLSTIFGATPEGEPLGFNRCKPADPSRYWKISGMVTSDYALHAIIDAGGVGAKANLDALSKGTVGRMDKEQTPFKGEWKEAISPLEVQRYKEQVFERLSELPPDLQEKVRQGNFATKFGMPKPEAEGR